MRTVWPKCTIWHSGESRWHYLKDPNARLAARVSLRSETVKRQPGETNPNTCKILSSCASPPTSPHWRDDKGPAVGVHYKKTLPMQLFLPVQREPDTDALLITTQKSSKMTNCTNLRGSTSMYAALTSPTCTLTTQRCSPLSNCAANHRKLGITTEKCIEAMRHTSDEKICSV